MKNIAIINGPNLNLLGQRDHQLYGTETMEQILANLRHTYRRTIEINYFQNNGEGPIIDYIQQLRSLPDCVGVVINAGAYTHTSLAIADARADSPLPFVEVHLSNVASREPIRRTSLIGPCCRGSIAGFGADVYRLGVEALIPLTEGMPS